MTQVSIKPLTAPDITDHGLARRLVASAAVSAVGDGFTIVALGLLTVSLTRNPWLVAAAFASERLPWLVGLQIARRVDRAEFPVRLLLAADLFRAAVLAVAAVTVHLDVASVPLVIALGALLGFGTVVHGAGRTVVLATLDDGEDLARTNGYLAAVEGIGYAVVGPALGAAAFALGTAIPLGVDAVTFLLSALALRPFARTASPDRSPRVGGSPVSVVRSTLRHPLLKVLLVITVALGLAEAITWSMLPLFAREHLRIEASSYGLFLAVAALGGVATGFITPHLWAARRATTLLAAGAVLTSGLALAALSGERSALAALGLFGVVNGVVGVTNTILPTLRLWHAPTTARGQTATLFRQVVVGVQPVGAALAAGIASRQGPRAAILAAGLLLVGVASLAAVPMHRALRGLESHRGSA